MGMGVSKVLHRWVLLVFLVLLVGWGSRPADASHRVYPTYQTYEAEKVSSNHRTAYHFQPPKNWINDPNGPLYYKGVYHLFYQYNPKGAVWGNIVWAHSVSTDLVNWTPLPPAIYPSKPFDINGCWSGSATILPGDRPAILYTGIDPDNRQVQNVAFPKDLSDPYLREWVKPDYNPVISPDASINASAFRDPTTAWMDRDGQWNVVVGSRRKHRGMAVLYQSRDFVNWVKVKHPLHSSAGTGMWECPDFYPVSRRHRNGLETSVVGREVKHVLKVSLDLTRYEYYTVGRYHPGVNRYVPDPASIDDHTGLRYDYGNFYASKTFYDPEKKRRVLWGWSNESDSRSIDVSKGWAGIQAIPRTLWLDEGGKQLVQWPVVELEKLRGKKVQVHNVKLRKEGRFEVKGILSSQADVEVTFQVSGLEKAEPFDPSWKDPQVLCGQKGADVGGGVGPFGLWVLASGDFRERTAVFFRVFRAPHKHVVLMCHDPSSSTTKADVWKPSFGGFVDVDIRKEGKISLRNLIDTSVVESFGAGGKTCITSRVYPVEAVGDAAHLYAFNNGEATVRISHLKAWQMGTPMMN
uniref:Beta-fructofuranosidase, insoluble isoenzyme 3 n=1 Tax=Anthurium amnicola TaxID=1678845 RepID=A0A1D1ZGR4_9ARAE